jgi:hypothetical protein
MFSIDALFIGYFFIFMMTLSMSIYIAIKGLKVNQHYNFKKIISINLLIFILLNFTFFKLTFPIGSGIFGTVWTFIGVIVSTVGVISLYITMYLLRRNAQKKYR